MNRGTIILTPFPFSDLTGKKVRPALVLTSENADDQDTIVAPISSVVRKYQPESDILLTPESSSFLNTGLQRTSIIKLRKLTAIDKKIIYGEIGVLDNTTMMEVGKKLLHVLGIPMM